MISRAVQRPRRPDQVRVQEPPRLLIAVRRLQAKVDSRQGPGF
ncbi:hypothetical protein ACP4OV_015319 [Aristida adscensionis]